VLAVCFLNIRRIDSRMHGIRLRRDVRLSDHRAVDLDRLEGRWRRADHSGQRGADCVVTGSL